MLTFRFSVECDPETKTLLCPRMILQPIIEMPSNMACPLDNGNILVKAQQRGHAEDFVGDNGVG